MTRHRWRWSAGGMRATCERCGLRRELAGWRRSGRTWERFTSRDGTVTERTMPKCDARRKP